MKGAARLFVVAYIVSVAFDSAIRWILQGIGAVELIYLRDLGLLSAAVLCCGVLIGERRDVTRSFWLLAALAVSASVALCSELGLEQAAFGMKLWLPFVCSFLLVEAEVIGALHVPRGWLLLWAILCFGLLVNYFYDYPWTGLTVEVADLKVMANREWTMHGVRRLSGFSRASYEAASLILILYIYLMTCMKRAGVRWLIAVVSGIAIALTTSKTVGAMYLATLVLLPLLQRPRGTSLSRVLVVAPIAVAGIGLVLPLISLHLDFPDLPRGSVQQVMLSSFIARAWTTWPQALELLSPWQLLTGRGLGGIGAAQELMPRDPYSPADNLFVYLYVTAGILGLALYGVLACASARIRLDDPLHRAAYLVLFSAFACGVTLNLIESPTFALALGFLLSTLTRKELNDPGAVDCSARISQST
jgi:hypothetical protein